MAAQGLVNGANGTVIGFKANNKTIDTQGEQNPDEILVLFDDKNNHHTLVLNTEIFQCILGVVHQCFIVDWYVLSRNNSLLTNVKNVSILVAF